ncbi:ABC transporter ATP-binding protein [uncultured Castellaniella sp.]|uniref:ABC transporter ATP-binding protein n=1 Tax=uncultured Castellaniella sp. TaxID=647907 RepID=UPI00261309CC|nr:ABC transporter ATP-binding protein [uncultured Castellaniella sp.]
MTAIIEAVGLRKQFGAVTAADDITISIARHTVVGLIGTNGAGKTTFINMITGYLKPDSGHVLYDGRDITSLSPRQVTRTGICRSFQIPQLFDSLSVRENLGIGLGIVLRNSRRSPIGPLPRHVPGFQGGIREAADQVLDQFGLTPHRDKAASTLPEGLRKLLDIAMAMVAQPKVLFLDEPTSGVSAEEKFQIMDRVMDAVRAQNVTVLFVEHDMDIIERYSERVLAFYAGRVLADGAAADVLTDPEVLMRVIGTPPATPPEAEPDRMMRETHA